jgi:hypothetical protein
MKGLKPTWNRRSKASPLVIAATLTASCAVLLIAGSSGSTGEPGSMNDGRVRTVNGGELPDSKPKLRDRRAPLSSEEVGYAYSIALEASTLPSDSTDVNGKPGAQLIHVDLPPIGEADGHNRLAAVIMRDYTRNQTHQVLVDLTRSEIVHAESAASAQPPPVPDEADAAIHIAISSSPPARFVTEFEQNNGIPLLEEKQVWYRAGSWVPPSGTSAGAECQKHRCVQLIVRDLSGAFFDTTDFVVDLTAQTLVTLRQRNAS